ncbi:MULTISPECIES: hypothetical protein [Myxococcus]|uniref:Lipoprotein n=1 Tax=Myxococcus llanfairpwllgwyngyllgogerychwyrndrobwllllantysiliogogogochensis TaxID=2590453 RepID=A0A540WSW9_9BACT|nr:MULTISPECIES: hypothetical protein [Myxococcus]NTX02551.1 hypothetical protein [Myxococcus sp. CA040A]NTX40930.1 hypothetical protein [Myxococcus sp. CA033]TQF12089.1 hypothetical protein FJV41_30865 [Myxococcus llanfairpwllgwyngyllgogerychwyrndrobwllllantysiliogogogochensis]
MKKTVSRILPLVMLLWGVGLSACGDSAPEPRRYELRLQGTSNRFSTTYLTANAVQVTLGGVPLRTELLTSSQRMDVAKATHAHLVAYFWLMPEQARGALEATVTLDDFGAFEGSDGSAGFVDARSAPLRLKLEGAALERNGRAVIHLDLDRSLGAERQGSRPLLPHLRLVY